MLRAAVLVVAPEPFLGEWAEVSKVLHSKSLLVDGFGFAKLVLEMMAPLELENFCYAWKKQQHHNLF